MARRSEQLGLAFRTRGGRRPGAGRKRAQANVGLQPHAARPDFVARVPVHVTMRAMRGVSALRAQTIARVVVDELTRASDDGFRVIHYSIQNDHVHLIAEGDDGRAFSRGMQRLASRIARLVNAMTSRRGQVWRERYHRRDLATPRQFRNALVYVTFNFRKHSPSDEKAKRARAIDGCSSGLWLDDWRDDDFREFVREQRERAGPRPTAEPATWIARVGWKRHGRLDPLEAPRSPC